MAARAAAAVSAIDSCTALVRRARSGGAPAPAPPPAPRHVSPLIAEAEAASHRSRVAAAQREAARSGHQEEPLARLRSARSRACDHALEDPTSTRTGTTDDHRAPSTPAAEPPDRPPSDHAQAPLFAELPAAGSPPARPPPDGPQPFPTEFGAVGRALSTAIAGCADKEVELALLRSTLADREAELQDVRASSGELGALTKRVQELEAEKAALTQTVQDMKRVAKIGVQHDTHSTPGSLEELCGRLKDAERRQQTAEDALRAGQALWGEQLGKMQRELMSARSDQGASQRELRTEMAAAAEERMRSSRLAAELEKAQHQLCAAVGDGGILRRLERERERWRQCERGLKDQLAEVERQYAHVRRGRDDAVATSAAHRRQAAAERQAAEAARRDADAVASERQALSDELVEALRAASLAEARLRQVESGVKSSFSAEADEQRAAAAEAASDALELRQEAARLRAALKAEKERADSTAQALASAQEEAREAAAAASTLEADVEALREREQQRERVQPSPAPTQDEPDAAEAVSMHEALSARDEELAKMREREAELLRELEQMRERVTLVAVSRSSTPSPDISRAASTPDHPARVGTDGMMDETVAAGKFLAVEASLRAELNQERRRASELEKGLVEKQRQLEEVRKLSTSAEAAPVGADPSVPLSEYRLGRAYGERAVSEGGAHSSDEESQVGSILALSVQIPEGSPRPLSPAKSSRAASPDATLDTQDSAFHPRKVQRSMSAAIVANATHRTRAEVAEAETEELRKRVADYEVRVNELERELRISQGKEAATVEAASWPRMGGMSEMRARLAEAECSAVALRAERDNLRVEMESQNRDTQDLRRRASVMEMQVTTAETVEQRITSGYEEEVERRAAAEEELQEAQRVIAVLQVERDHLRGHDHDGQSECAPSIAPSFAQSMRSHSEPHASFDAPGLAAVLRAENDEVRRRLTESQAREAQLEQKLAELNVRLETLQSAAPAQAPAAASPTDDDEAGLPQRIVALEASIAELEQEKQALVSANSEALEQVAALQRRLDAAPLDGAALDATATAQAVVAASDTQASLENDIRELNELCDMMTTENEELQGRVRALDARVLELEEEVQLQQELIEEMETR
eukprot:TRINITY_DN25742_c0_g1_i1.p1 TRINITY_DN25742_c0_g1~~TRINITY_DN25742_c0_g1_i1.p1  ORF type:complete len:1154 (+),score=420.00 TRINITY_DN25742_c0_g1_i1:118-3462(+)